MREKETENVENFTRLRIFKEDTRTGEVYEELDMEKHYVIKKSAFKKRKLSRNASPYVWAVYQASARLLEMLPGKHVAMLFYLATFFGYDGYLTTGKKPIYKKQLPKLLGVGESTAYRCWNGVVRAGIAREDREGRLCLNEQFFDRGRLSQKRLATLASENTYVTRLYVNGVRDLYRTATATSRNTLSYLFQILPFVNREYNIVCHNPLETDLDKVIPMDMDELCGEIGYDKKNVPRLLRELLKLKFTVGDKQEWAVGYAVTGRQPDRHCRELFINPSVYYAGRDWDAVKVLGKF